MSTTVHEPHPSHAAQALDHDLLLRLTPTMRRFTLFGKVAVVTGGARGLGHAVAQALAEAGVRGIAILDINQELGEISAHLMAGQTHTDCRFYKVDIRNEHTVHEAMNHVVQHFGRVDILVNSAGIINSNIPAESYPPDSFRHMMDVNLTGAFLVAKECATRMIAQKDGGSIIFIASMSGCCVNYPQEQCAYNASKAGVLQLMKSLAAEWAEFGIRVNAISPGYMNTAVIKGHGLEPLKVIWKDRTPQGRLGNAHDLSGCAVYLASEASEFVTGANHLVDGGYTVY